MGRIAWTDLVGSLVWAGMSLLHLSLALQGGRYLLSLGLCFFYLLIAALMLARRPAQHTAPWPQTLVAWFAAVLPMAGFRPTGTGGVLGLALVMQGLACIGLIAAVATLGRSFSIAPADRGLVTSGPYRVLRHPIYAAELVFNVGYLLANPSWGNAAVLILMLATQIVRIRYEECLIEGYVSYAGQVRWRLVPGIW